MNSIIKMREFIPLLVLIFIALVVTDVKPNLNNPPQVGDIFSAFHILFWVLLIFYSITGVLIIGISKSYIVHIVLSVSMWLLMVIKPVYMAFPSMWKGSVGQVVLANNINNWIGIQAKGWPGAYLLLTSFSNVVNIDNLTTSLLLSMALLFVIFIMLFMIGRKLVGRNNAYILPLILALASPYLSAIYYYSDQLLGFVHLLTLIHLSTENPRTARNATIFILLSSALVITHPITAILFFGGLSISLFLQTVYKYSSSPHVLLLFFVMFAGWHLHNYYSCVLIRPYILSLLSQPYIWENASPTSHLAHPTLPQMFSFAYRFVILARYIYLTLLGLLTIGGILYFKKELYKRREAIPFLALLITAAIFIAIDTQRHFSNRAMLFLLTSSSCISGLFLTKTRLKKLLLCCFVILLPLLFAATFLPSIQLAYTHTWELTSGSFYALHLPRKSPILIDGDSFFTMIYYDPNIIANRSLTGAVMGEINPSSFLHGINNLLILRSLRQDMTSQMIYGVNASGWRVFDMNLQNSTSLIYNNYYVKIFFKL